MKNLIIIIQPYIIMTVYSSPMPVPWAGLERPDVASFPLTEDLVPYRCGHFPHR